MMQVFFRMHDAEWQEQLAANVSHEHQTRDARIDAFGAFNHTISSYCILEPVL